MNEVSEKRCKSFILHGGAYTFTSHLYSLSAMHRMDLSSITHYVNVGFRIVKRYYNTKQGIQGIPCILRGGAFYSDEWIARCAYRAVSCPDDHSGYDSFRCMKRTK